SLVSRPPPPLSTLFPYTTLFRSQMVSSVLVLRCLYQSEGSYQFRFRKLSIKGVYVKRIFQVGIPAGIQSTVINFSNALLQSSVRSEEHTSELQSRFDLVCRLLLE